MWRNTGVQIILKGRTNVSLCPIMSDQFSASRNIDAVDITEADWGSSTRKEYLQGRKRERERKSEREKERQKNREQDRESEKRRENVHIK